MSSYDTSSPAPRRIRRIVARVQARDRAYFARHPEAWFYWREAIPGEFGPENVPPGEPVFVFRSPSPLVRIRRCADVVAVDLEGRAAEYAERLGPPAGASWIDVFKGDIGPGGDRP